MAKRVLELKNNQAQVKGDSQILIYKDAESDVSMSEGADNDKEEEEFDSEEEIKEIPIGGSKRRHMDDDDLGSQSLDDSVSSSGSDGYDDGAADVGEDMSFGSQ